MKIVNRYPDNVFSWVDLSTTDTEGAKVFYAGLFGWEMRDLPTDMDSIYTMCHIDGHNVSGLSQLSDEMQAQGMSPLWSSYVNSYDVDAVVERAAAAGATNLFPTMDVMDSGRMAFMHDPTGAAVGVWQPNQHKGADVVNSPNTLVWNELQTRDGEAAKAFYKATFGWESQTDESGYVTFLADGRRHAGMLVMDESFGDMPPNWVVYFMVDDVDAAAARAQALGGHALVPPTPAGEIARFSALQDPQGGVFSIINFKGPTDDPPNA